MPSTLTTTTSEDSWSDVTLGIKNGYIENNTGHDIYYLRQDTDPGPSVGTGVRIEPFEKIPFNLDNGDRLWARGRNEPGRITTTPNTLPVSIHIGDGAQADAFGHLRVSSPTSAWDNKNIHDRRLNHWSEQVVGGGAIAFIPNESSVSLSVGTADGDRALRQTFRYMAYVPGRSQDISITGVLNPGKDNLWQGVGYFDDLDGPHFELEGTDLYVVTRSSTSGSPVDTRVHQNDPAKSTDGVSVWNIDSLDGSGDQNNPSGMLLDITKAQIFKIDIQWLGVGRERFGFNLVGQTFYVHQTLNANVLDKVYMSTPSLPIRYEIKNIGITASASTLKEICNSVDSEGGYQLPGFQYSASNGIVTRSIIVRTPILAFRLVNSMSGKSNRRTARFLAAHFYTGGTNDVCYEVVHLHTPIVDVGGTWSTVGLAGSACEFNVGLTSLTGSVSHITHPSYNPTGQGGSAEASDLSGNFITEHDFINQNFDSTDSQVFAVFATPMTGTAVVAAGIEWMEFD